jgi:hypothetical protein
MIATGNPSTPAIAVLTALRAGSAAVSRPEYDVAVAAHRNKRTASKRAVKHAVTHDDAKRS